MRWLIVGLISLLAAACGEAPAPDGALDEPDPAAQPAEGERLRALYGPRLPVTSGDITFTTYPRGISGGVAAIDYEVQSDLLDNPPLIVAIGGSESGWWLGGPGRLPVSRSIGWMLMSHGFSIRSLAHFGGEVNPAWLGEGELPPRLVERPLEPIAARIAQARSLESGARRCVGLVGVSKGGELTMVLAAHGDELAGPAAPLVDAAVANVPSHVVWQSPHVTLAVRSSWSLGGEPLDFVPYPWFSRHTLPTVFNLPNATQLSEAALRNRRAAEAATIPVETIDIPLLMQAGAHDPIWPSAPMAEAALARADALAPGHDLRLTTYETDHFVFSEPEAVLEAVAFFYETLRAAAEAGACEADFLPLASETAD